MHSGSRIKSCTAYLESKLSVFIKILNIYTFGPDVDFQVTSLEENLDMCAMKHIEDFPCCMFIE